MPILTPNSDHPVAVIGAGPHGLAAVAHLRAAGVPTRVFGEPLRFWRDGMPKGMWLRSSPSASNISSPGRELSLSRWAEEHNRQLGAICDIEDFIAYGSWFQALAAPDLDRRLVTSVERHSEGFVITLADGEQMLASRVVVAAGLSSFAHVPSVFESLPNALASHSSQNPDVERFAGHTVAVIGAGQSALESAALLHEAGADVEVIARAKAIFWINFGIGGDGDGAGPIIPPPKGPPPPPTWRARRGWHWRTAPTEVGGRFSSWVGAAPDVVRHFPRHARAPLTYHCIKPAAAYWLPDRLRAVRITLAHKVITAQEHDGKALLRLDDGSQRIVDHVLLGTGYRIDVHRYPFIGHTLGTELRTIDGSPVLRRGLESSVPGLHFVGAPAAESFGPAMRFVVGTFYTAPALTQAVVGEQRPLFRWAF